MERSMKRICKLAGAACAATGVVAVSALVASGAAVGAIAEGFKAASSTVKHILNDQTQDTDTAQAPIPAEVEEEHL